MKINVLILVLAFSLGFCRAADAQVPELYRVQGIKIPAVTIPSGWSQKEAVKGLDLTFFTMNRDRDYAIYERNYMNLTTPNLLRQELEQIEISVAPGEYEPVVFGIFAVNDLIGVKISVDDLNDGKDNLLSKDNIDVRVVSYFPKKTKEEKTYRLEPLLLERFTALNMRKNENKILWCTVFVPENTPSGDYSGRIYINLPNKPKGSIGLKIQVLPFKLQDPPTNFGIYYNMDNRWEGFYPENTKRDFIDIREHGLVSLTIFNSPSVSKEEDGSAAFDFSESSLYFLLGLDNIMDLYMETGLKGPIPYLGVWYGLSGEITKSFGYKQQTLEFDRIYIEALRAIENHRKMKGWPEFLYSPEDEPASSDEKFKTAKRYLQLIKMALPDSRTYMTLNGLSRGVNDGAMLNSWIDVRCYPFAKSNVIKATNEAKDEFWVYNGGSEGAHPILDRFFYGFYGAKSAANGIYQWVYQWPSSLEATPYEELTQEIQGWYYTYPSPEGPVPTPAWEGVREGIDDAKYLYTLQELIKKAKNLGNSKVIKEAVKAEGYIQQIFSQIDLNLPTPQESAHTILGWAPYWKTEVLDTWRKTLIEKILILRELLEQSETGND